MARVDIWTVNDGKIEVVSYDNGERSVLASCEVNSRTVNYLARLIRDYKLGGLCSSSVHYPEEHGLPGVDVDKLISTAFRRAYLI